MTGSQESISSKKELNRSTKSELIEIISSPSESTKMSDPRVKKIQIDNYHGVNDDMDACDWIELYEILADEAKWPQTTKIIHLPSYLRGQES